MTTWTNTFNNNTKDNNIDLQCSDNKQSSLGNQYKASTQNNVTIIQQNIFCSPDKLNFNLNHIDNNIYSVNDSHSIQISKGNYNDPLMKPDEEEKTRILNTYFSELKDTNSQSNQAEMLNIKAFLFYTKKNKITSITKPNGALAGYSAYTYKNQKQYNEDRMNIAFSSKDNHIISFYSLFDGHGGTEAADLLSQSFCINLLNNKDLLTNKTNAILKEMNRIEDQLTNDFITKNKNKKNKEEFIASGSCALVLMSIDDIISITHIGDSKGIISMNNGNNVYSLTIDHHPNVESEKVRILNNGGEVKYDSRSKTSKTQRVFPGGLAISRSIGDTEAKLPSYGGKTNVIISIPDIISFKYKKEFDFIVLCTDGISGKVSNREICLIVYQTLSKCIDKLFSYEQLLQKCTINIMKEAINKGSRDNLTCIFICFDSFKKLYDMRNKAQIEESISHLKKTVINCDNLYDDLDNEYFINKESKGKMTSQKTGMNLNRKSILNSNNIQIVTSELSFQESNISIEGKKSSMKREDKKKKKSKGGMSCCGLFA